MIVLFRRISVILALLALCVISGSAYDDSPPESSPFVGSCYITADSSALGIVDIYIPVSYQSGYFGYSDDGDLFNVSNSSVSGILYTSNGTEYSFRCSSWSVPQYRSISGSSYTYYDLGIDEIISSNVQIAESFPALVPVDDIFPAIYVLIGGVVILCLFLKRF